MRAAGTFHVDQWEESTDEAIDDGSKITRASVRQTFSGGLEGEGWVSYLMAYRARESAVFVGLQRLTSRSTDAPAFL